MSYDFYLVPRESAKDPLEAVRAIMEDRDADATPGPAGPFKEARKRRVAETLQTADPSIRSFPFDHAEIAKVTGQSIEQAKRNFRHIELNGPDGSSGIQITLFDDYATLTIPYWHTGVDANMVFPDVWKKLQLMQRVGVYVVYDAQVDRVLDLEIDRVPITGVHGKVSGQVQTMFNDDGARPARPWWKFW